MRIYIHIPYCHARCAYCDFYSTVTRGKIDLYVDCLINELRSRAQEWQGEPLKSLYIGGGTPSLLPLPLLGRLLGEMPIGTETEEITIEANPEDVTADWVRYVASSPINRVSMGVQSLNDEQLRFIGRRHTAAQAVSAVKTLRDGGINNISLDLIYGLPGQDLESWHMSLQGLLELRPEHLSAYLLSYERGTRLHAMLQAGKVQEASDELVSQMYQLLCRETARQGYEHYEISNFALPGHRARHNSAYWTGEDYLGLGPGAHSCVHGLRSANPSKLHDYLRASGVGTNVLEEESENEKFNDLVITRLRTADGLNLDTCPNRDMVVRTAAPYLRDGRMTQAGSRIRISEEAWLTSDAIMESFIMV